MLATRHGRAATKAAWPEGRAVQTETLFGFLMATTIGPADSSSCRIAGQPCLAFVQQRFATHTTFFWMFQQKWRRSGNDPRNYSFTGWKLGRATMDLGERRVLMGEVSTGVVNHRRVASWLRGAARGSTAVLVTGAILLSFGCGARPKAEPAKVPLAPQSYTDGLLQQLPVPPGTRPWASHFYPGGFWGPYLFPHAPLVSGAASSTRLYVSQKSPRAIAGYVIAHELRGGSGLRLGRPDEANGGTSGSEYSVATPPGSGYTATVEYSVTPFGHGEDLLRVDAKAWWVERRLPVETMAAGYVGQLTAFTSLSHAQGDRGPVTAQLRPADARRLVEAVNSLPPEPDFLCFEDVLLYSISLHPPGHASPGYVLQAYSCGYDLFVSVDGVPLPPLWSGGCRFVRLLLALVPERAVGTRTWATGCARAPMTVVTNPS